MGRSGGGHHRSGGGFRSHSHYHSHSYHRSYHRSSYGSRGRCNPIPGVIIFITICIAVAVIFSIIPGEENVSVSRPELSPKEQYLFCNSKETRLDYSSSNIKVYESLDGVPELSNETREISVSWYGNLYNSYSYKSFFMPPGSCISGHKNHMSGSADFIVLKGWNNMRKLINDSPYSFLYKNSKNDFEICSEEFDEYFVVIDTRHSASYTAELNVELTTYDTEGLTEECTTTQDECVLNKDNNYNFCVVIDYDVYSSSYPNVEVSINIDESNLGAGVIAGIVIVALVCVVTIALAIFIIVKRAKSSNAASQDYSQMTSTQIETLPDTVGYGGNSQSDVPTAIITTETYNPPVNTYPAAPAPAASYTTGPMDSNSGLFSPINTASYPADPKSY